MERNSNIKTLTVYLYNPPRNDSSTGKGSNVFKTTHTFRNVETKEDAMNIINDLFANHSQMGTMNYKAVKKAYYNNACIIHEGKLKGNVL